MKKNVDLETECLEASKKNIYYPNKIWMNAYEEFFRCKQIYDECWEVEVQPKQGSQSCEATFCSVVSKR